MTAPAHRLVDRDDVLAGLARQLDRAGEHGPARVLVTGAEGTGKTAVLDALASRHDGPVLRARGADWETGRASGVLHQLLRSTDVPTAPFAAAELLAARVGDTPALALVDDAQWADPESLRALSTAVRHCHEMPLLVVAAARMEEAGPVAADLLSRAADETIAVRPLSPRSVAELAADRGRTLPAWVAARLCRHTGGRPRHVLALIDELPESAWARQDIRLPPPVSIAASVTGRLLDAAPATRALVDAVAVLGHPATLDEIERLAGLDDLLVPLEAASRAGLVVRSGGRWGPVAEPADPMVRAAVLDAMGPGAAADARRRAAETVTDPVRQLGYLAAATPGRDPELADRLDRLAREKAVDGAWSAVGDLLAEASRLTEDRELSEDRLTEAVDAMVGAGDGLAAGALIPVIESFRETPLRNAMLGYLAVILGRAGEAEIRLGRAWELVDASGDPATAALICQRNVLDALVRLDGAALIEWADRAVALVGPDAPAAVEAAAIRGLGTAADGRPGLAVEEYREITRRVRHGAQAQRVTMGKGWLDVVVDDVERARAELESAVPTTFLGGSSRISLWALAWLARVRFAMGEWDLALRAVDQGLTLAERSGIVLTTPLLAWTAAQVHSLRGDADRAARAAREAGAAGDEYAIMRVPAHLARAQLAEDQADYPGVVRSLEPLTESCAGATLDEPGWWPWADVYANALVLEGRLNEADTFLRPHEELAAARRHRSAGARLGYARGRLHGARGDVDAARASFEGALTLLDGLPLRYDRARVTFAYGQTLRRAGKRRDADAVISAARELFLTFGATSYVARCDRELKAGGVNATRGERDAVELTAQEKAVSDLVTRGLSNREAAAELHVSPKTVQYHLTHVYAKLGIRSRSELAGLLGARPDHGSSTSETP
jgi:DNA-binding CsgD family transcriptional regulator